MNKSTLVLILVLFIVALVLAIIVSIFGAKKPTSTPIPPVLQASFTPSPNPASRVTEPLALVSIDPTEDTSTTYMPIKQVYFAFNKPMSPISFIIKVSPEAKVVVTLKPDDPNTIIVSPQPKWETGITTMTIANTTSSADGSKLKQSIVYKINTQFPKNPPPDSPGL